MDYREELKKPEYNFLRENKYLGKNISLLALGGSIAYGTNLDDSDIDIRGMSMNPTKQLFNLESDFEQVADTDTDTVVYSFNKLARLLLQCNPNTIEILGCKPEHYLYLNNYGKEVLNHKKDFLSVVAIDRFGGYAFDQYNRLEHGLLGNGENDDKKLAMLKHSLEKAMGSFILMHKELGIKSSFRIVDTAELKALYPGRKVDDDLSNDHILVSIDKITDMPITDFKPMISSIHKVQSEYGKINKRNNKKTPKALAKHMMHLIRLYMMGTAINTSLNIRTYIEGKDHDLLMSIRNMDYMVGDGFKIRDEFYDVLNEVQKEYEYSLKHTVLPDEPNYEALNEMMLSIYKDVINNSK